MKKKLFDMTKKHVMKLVIVLLLAVLLLSFLPNNPGSYAYFDGTLNADTVSANNAYEAVVIAHVTKVTISGVAGDSDILPQTGGITPATLIGLLGLALIATGGSIFTILRKKNHGTYN